METQKVKPNDKKHWLELRSKYINSTDVSALFNCNPYMTEFELWHKLKSPQVIELEQNERMQWGNALESAIANEVARQNKWDIEPFKDYMYIQDLGLGSSFDFKIAPPESALLEIKNVDGLAYNQKWIEHSETEIEAPLHIELQVQHQMLVSGINKAYIAALVGGNTLKLIKRELNTNIANAIRSKAKQFWDSIQNNNPPEVDYDRDSEFIIKMNGFVNPGKVINSDENIDKLVTEYTNISSAIKDLESQKEMFKAKILEYISDAEKVKGSNYTISAGMTQETQVSFTRKAFRNFRIVSKKVKDEHI